MKEPDKKETLKRVQKLFENVNKIKMKMSQEEADKKNEINVVGIRDVIKNELINLKENIKIKDPQTGHDKIIFGCIERIALILNTLFEDLLSAGFKPYTPEESKKAFQDLNRDYPGLFPDKIIKLRSKKNGR